MYARKIYAYERKDNWPVLGLDEEGTLSFGTYPNPVNNELKTHLTLSQKSRVVIYDVLGKEKLNKEFNKTKISINTNSFSKGIYIMKVIQGNRENS